MTIYLIELIGHVTCQRSLKKAYKVLSDTIDGLPPLKEVRKQISEEDAYCFDDGDDQYRIIKTELF